MRKKDIEKLKRVNCNINKVQYCMKCGAPLVRSSVDKNHNSDPHYETRLKLGLCVDCFGSDPDKTNKNIRKF